MFGETGLLFEQSKDERPLGLIYSADFLQPHFASTIPLNANSVFLTEGIRHIRTNSRHINFLMKFDCFRVPVTVLRSQQAPPAEPSGQPRFARRVLRKIKRTVKSYAQIN